MRDELSAAYLCQRLCSSSNNTAHNTYVNDSHLNKMIIRPVVISTHRKVRCVVDDTNSTILANQHNDDDDKDGDDNCTNRDDAKDRKASLIQSLMTLCRTEKSPFPSLSSIGCGDADSASEEARNE